MLLNNKREEEIQEHYLEMTLETRISIFQNLKQLLADSTSEYIIEEIVPLFLYESRLDNENTRPYLVSGLLIIDNILIPNNINQLLEICYSLFCSEDSKTRLLTLESLSTLLSRYADSTNITIIALNLVKRLSNGIWFTEKESSANILGILIEYLDPELLESVGRLFNILISDDNPIVKKAIVNTCCITHLVFPFDSSYVLFYSLATYLYNDKNDISILLSIDLYLISIQKTKNLSNHKNIIDKIVLLKNSKYWKIRYTLASKLDLYLNCIINNNELIEKLDIINTIINIFHELANDNEDEVRLAISNRIISLIIILDDLTIIGNILGIYIRLGCDHSIYIRKSIAESYYLLITTLIKKSIIDSTSLRGYDDTNIGIDGIMDEGIDAIRDEITIFKDEEDEEDMSQVANKLPTNPAHMSQVANKLPTDPLSKQLRKLLNGLLLDKESEIKLAILKEMKEITQTLALANIDIYISKLLINISYDKSWRNRRTSIILFQTYMETLPVGIYETLYLPIIFSYFLNDKVFKVREITINNLINAIKQYGEKWGIDRIILPMIKRVNKEDHITRMTLLYYSEKLYEIVSINTNLNIILEIVINQTYDPIINVRLLAIRILDNIYRKLIKDKLYKENKKLYSIIKIANLLSTDNDKEIRYYSERILKAGRMYDGMG
eukprot:GHVP01036470.1.p1 GENE.GHVP01036470.1~~GHVP01036470.1.p1  ORF type:complete len:669 (-),score=67.80 GHVP01036470.1:280-2286(-)